jgi:hypothetical protein
MGKFDARFTAVSNRRLKASRLQDHRNGVGHYGVVINYENAWGTFASPSGLSR